MKKRILCILLCMMVALTGCRSASKEKGDSKTSKQEPTDNNGKTAKERYDPEKAIERVLEWRDSGEAFYGSISFGRDVVASIYRTKDCFLYVLRDTVSEKAEFHFYDLATGERYYSVNTLLGADYIEDGDLSCTVDKASPDDLDIWDISLGTNEGAYFDEEPNPSGGFDIFVPEKNVHGKFVLPFLPQSFLDELSLNLEGDIRVGMLFKDDYISVDAYPVWYIFGKEEFSLRQVSGIANWDREKRFPLWLIELVNKYES